MKKLPVSMLSVAAVAARLGPSRKVIYRWCEAGLIGNRKYPSGAVYIPLAEVERVERESERAPVVAPFPKPSRIHSKRGTDGKDGTLSRDVTN